jgi:hypothetical protein
MSCSVSEPFVKRDAAPNPELKPTPSDREDVPF